MSEPGNDQTAETIRMVTESMALLRAEVERSSLRSDEIAGRTARIFRGVAFFLLLSSGYLGYLVFVMSQHMGNVTDQLGTMYQRFGRMSGDMRKITTSVERMGRSVEGIPVIAGDMRTMNDDVAIMLSAIKDVDGNLSGLNANMRQLSGDTSEMAQNFAAVNQTVQRMSYNVNQLAAPLNGPLR